MEAQPYSSRTALQPERMKYAVDQITSCGYEITFQSENEVRFQFKGSEIKFYPFTGWATGKTIKDGRGIKNLIKQIRNES